LREISPMSEKRKSLKAQLTFRKNVLHQVASDKSLFLFNMGKKARKVEELKANLVKLIAESVRGKTEEKRDTRKPLLVGKHIKHKFDNKWYFGQVLSVVPSFIEWYNVKYTDDPAVYVFKLQEDYAAGDLKIVLHSQSK